ncbi:phospholipase/carboxylesterase [Halalkaliarchaeum desulfuricum]|uniref:Phospholipase/carboxylesterase n=1 Tax=Halalkaliarchaeum desulfuricum TaxID=2055893 RepID=A0A343TN62_9EURY|nr:alpha/beta hydrolase-fold protein [Halalkaliarchaeum desulfuricum]AUX10534.1 phospholipase/carboxylesterase [Halalkaliarchaeum desulfuricum]
MVGKRDIFDRVRDSDSIQRGVSLIFNRRFQSGKKNGSVELPYRLYLPNCYNKHDEKRYPIVLTFHGAGKRGRDNRRQIYSSAVFFSSNRVQRREPCFVLAPQCPPGNSWVNLKSWSEGTHPLREITPALQTSIQLLDDLLDEYRIDRGRQFVTGFSMGGYGTWDAITRFPNRFEAAIPISGGGTPGAADRLDRVKVWAFHGAEDDTVPVSGTRRMIEAMRNEGLDPRYTEFEALGHSSRPVFRQEGLIEWLFDPNTGE